MQKSATIRRMTVVASMGGLIDMATERMRFQMFAQTDNYDLDDVYGNSRYDLLQRAKLLAKEMRELRSLKVTILEVE